MRTLLRELRSILEREREFYGSFLPVDERADPQPAGTRPAPDDEPAEATHPDNDASEDAPAGDPAEDRPLENGRSEGGSSERTSERTPPREDASEHKSSEEEASGEDPSEKDPSEEEASGAGAAADDGLTGGAPADRDEQSSGEPPSRDALAGDDDAPGSDDASTAASDDSDSEPMPNYDLFGNQVDPTEDPSLPPWERIKALIPDDAPYRDATTLEEVEEYLADTVLVPIDEDRENPVFGVGDPESDLVIIGEAPGRDEDKEGEPFVGRAGTLLDKILDAIHFEREDVYITNILKSRPPRNRNPKDEEVEAHLPILYKQIELIRPEIILCVGKVAGNTMLDRRSSLSNLRESEHDFYGIPLLVTYHPAALLRNPQWKRPTWEDVKLLRTRYDQLTDGEDAA
jgi:DNA polymerase